MLAVRGVFFVILLSLIWQFFVVIFSIPSYILPSPASVLLSFVNHFSLIAANLMPTLFETIFGLLLGIFLGTLLALLMSLFPFFGYWLLPIVIVSQAIPTFALAPLLILWFGYGVLSKILTVTLMLFFPVTSALYEGLKKTPQSWLDMASTMSGTKLGILFYLKLPAARSHYFAGIKVATTLAPIGAIVSEWIGASQGLGFLMLNANARLEIDLMFACLIAIMIMSLCLYGAVNKLINKFNS